MADVCPVCLESLEGVLVTRLWCGHAFHAECILKWMMHGATKTCPTCRRDADHPFLQVLLSFAQNEKLFGTIRRHATVTKLFPRSRGSCFLAAVECAVKSLACANRRQKLAYMLIFLHLSGNARASAAASAATFDEAGAIARGLARAMLSSVRTSVVPAAARQTLSRLRRDIDDFPEPRARRNLEVLKLCKKAEQCRALIQKLEQHLEHLELAINEKSY